MISDEKLKRTFEVFVDEESILRATIFKEIKGAIDNTRQIELMEEDLLDIFNKDSSKKYKVIFDLLPLGRGKIYTSSGDRKIWARLARHKQIERCSIIGSSLILRVVANFVISLSGRNKDIKWFFNKDEALKWLKEE